LPKNLNKIWDLCQIPNSVVIYNLVPDQIMANIGHYLGKGVDKAAKKDYN